MRQLQITTDTEQVNRRTAIIGLIGLLMTLKCGARG